jgi:hypothetical protein
VAGEFDEGIVDSVIGSPTQWPDVIKRLWNLVRQEQPSML